MRWTKQQVEKMARLQSLISNDEIGEYFGISGQYVSVILYRYRNGTTKFKGSRKPELLKEYEKLVSEGLTVRQIAERTGRKYRTVYEFLRRHGFQLEGWKEAA